MHKSTAVFVFTSIALACSTIYFQRHHHSTLQELERLRQDHAAQTAVLTQEFQAEIQDLQQYILNQYRGGTGSVGGNRPLPAVKPSLDMSLTETVERKYRYLLADITDETVRETLKLLLLELENAITETGRPDYEARLAEIDARIGELLDVADYQKYAALRKSTVEQHHLNIYARGTEQIAPLSPDQHRALLFAKLQHKNSFEAVLRDSGMQQERLSRIEMEHAHAAIEQSLREYKRNYLEEAKQLLNAEQFALLEEYESTEFALELERLQAQINTKM
jgi:hypothetical protein